MTNKLSASTCKRKIRNFFDWKRPISRKESLIVGTLTTAPPTMLVILWSIYNMPASLFQNGGEIIFLAILIALVLSPISWTIAIRRAKTVGMHKYWLWCLFCLWIISLTGLRFAPFSMLEFAINMRLLFLMPNKYSFDKS